MDKQQPLNPNGPATTPRTTSLNDRLNTSYVDLGPDENSMSAQVIGTITDAVGSLVSPRRLLVLLRILKAVTF